MQVLALAPPLDPSINWPRELRAAMFILAGEIQSIARDIEATSHTLDASTSRWQRVQRERLIDRWTDQRRKLLLFFDGCVFADTRPMR